jgi:hypothetical protein
MVSPSFDQRAARRAPGWPPVPMRRLPWPVDGRLDDRSGWSPPLRRTLRSSVRVHVHVRTGSCAVPPCALAERGFAQRTGADPSPRLYASTVMSVIPGAGR